MEPKPTQATDGTNHAASRKQRQVATLRARRKPTPKLVFEPDTDEPQTIESLAAQQRKFLAANKQEWVDVDLPSHG